jgi:hypothetical protein
VQASWEFYVTVEEKALKFLSFKIFSTKKQPPLSAAVFLLFAQRSWQTRPVARIHEQSPGSGLQSCRRVYLTFFS